MKGVIKLEGRNYTEYILKNYHQIKRELEGKKALLKVTICECEEEFIEGRTFQTFGEEKVKNSTIADKTANIAISYRDLMAREVEEQVRGLTMDIRKRELELLRVEKAVEVLEEKHQRVIKGLYFQGKSRRQLCRELYISEGTLSRWRRKSVDNICKFALLRG